MIILMIKQAIKAKSKTYISPRIIILNNPTRRRKIIILFNFVPVVKFV